MAELWENVGKLWEYCGIKCREFRFPILRNMWKIGDFTMWEICEENLEIFENVAEI